MLKLAELKDSLKYGHGNVLAKYEGFVITKPLNTWDTNYRLYDEKEELVYLIDCGDLYECDLDLLELSLEEIKELSWKTEKEMHE